MMLKPGSGIIRSMSYAKNLRRWKEAIPAEQLKVVITEDLEREPDRVIKETLVFLGLSPSLMPAGSTHTCVTGKKGIMDEAPEGRAPGKGRVTAGQFGAAETAGLSIGACSSWSEKHTGKGGVARYKMDPAVESMLRTFFAPYNERLVELLGYDPGWARPGERS